MLFGLVLAGRPGADAGASWPASALRKGGELSFSAYPVHLPVMSGVHAALAERTPPTLSMLVSLAAIAAATFIWDALIVTPAAQIGKRLSERWILLNCKPGADGRHPSRQIIRSIGSQYSHLPGNGCAPEQPVEKERACYTKFSSKQSQRWVATIRIIKNWQILRQTRAAELPQLGLNCEENRSFS